MTETKLPPLRIRFPSYNKRSDRVWSPVKNAEGFNLFATVEFTLIGNTKDTRLSYICACQGWTTGTFPTPPDGNVPDWILTQMKRHIKDEHNK